MDGQDPGQNVINCWSSPRTVSTSCMYSWAQRSDVAEVLDEPLYANYLKITGSERPYKDLVFSSQDADGNRVVEELILAPREGNKVVYVKHMAKQRLGISKALLQGSRHVLLVREPMSVIQSFSEVLEPNLQETCYPALCELYSELRCLGRPPPVVLSDDLVRDPEGTLRALCAALDLPFERSMLQWPAGPKPYDGVWAPWWYAQTHLSTGFERPVQRPRRLLPPHLRPLLEESWPMWEMLRRHALRPLGAGAPAVPRPLPQAPAGSAAAAAEGAAGDAAASGRQGVAGQAGQQKEHKGTHAYTADPRNDDILIGIRDGITGAFSLVWRPAAKVSVLDSGFMLGDGVWEGMRLHAGVLLFVRQHMERLFEGAKAIDMDIGLTPQQLVQLVYDTVDANGMGEASNVHIRLMVTRGLKPTPYQNPNITLGQPTIVCIPEYKEAAAGPKETGIRLFTCHVRRGPADVQDPSWNSHSKLNCIAACIQANKAGADEALMLDPHGFVATCNSVNFFIVRTGEVWAPTTKYQLHGITRQNTINLCVANGIPVRELDFSLTKVYSADEAFVTGTFGGQTPVREVDGRVIGDGRRGPVVARLQQLYRDLCNREAAQGREAVASG